MAQKILCTGGAGYIGIHTVCRLFENGYECVIVDNLVNPSTHVKAVSRLEKILGRKIKFVQADVRDEAAMRELFLTEKFDGVIHYAALKSVPESVELAVDYYQNNLVGLLTLLRIMKETGVTKFVFSSSCTVYKPSDAPLREDNAIGASNPYGQTKVMCEQILRDACIADKTLKVSLLRYFNPVGAHSSGLLGESADAPLNLLPYIQQVAIGNRKALKVFGNDWPTRDGSGIRDYINVMDLADGHIKALAKLNDLSGGTCIAHNLGTGTGTSVLELVKAFETSTGVNIPYEFAPRRAGDIATAVCDPALAEKELNWKAVKTIEESCQTAHKWQTMNPKGYLTELPEDK